jgi:hypothetical protein
MKRVLSFIPLDQRILVHRKVVHFFSDSVLLNANPKDNKKVQ